MRYLVSALTLVVTIFAASGDTLAQASQPPTTGDVQVIEVTAKKYDFNPSSIRVKQGTRVQLKVTATDRSHGFKIQEFPEGGAKGNQPGLVFSSPQDCQKIEKSQTQTIEFVAKAPGTYRFRCCVRCGLHHRSMKGELIVEP
ncbi:MAG TPA: cupredoxin domain-containing protein [Terriglobales bacterium]|nr:cupredoxin domain-containing protein [Terriglobales bacterium]